MARRNADGSHARTKIGKVQGRDKAIIVRGEKRTRVAEIGADGTALPSTEELVESGDVVDIRHVHDVTTGQRRVVVLPADLCRRLGISEGTPLRLVEHDSHFEVIPMRLVPATESTSYALDSLLAGVTAENIHGEIDIGPAVGRESW
jgi:antitoxin component of MazEF toxin-antitoxin module